MNEAELFAQRQTRMFRAVALEKPDRVPVVLEYAGFAASITGTPLSEFLGSIARSVEVMIEAFNAVGNADGIDYGAYLRV